jgi:hypothetical protein
MLRVDPFPLTFEPLLLTVDPLPLTVETFLLTVKTLTLIVESFLLSWPLLYPSTHVFQTLRNF